jgi:hypothetical protein
MPTISMFYGIVIRMYFAPGEHSPPHSDVYYNEYRATVDIRTCGLLTGDLPKKQAKLALAWAELHQRIDGELEACYECGGTVQDSAAAIGGSYVSVGS